MYDSQTQRKLVGARGEGGCGELGEGGKGIKKYKLVATKQSQGCKVPHREYRQ